MLRWIMTAALALAALPASAQPFPSRPVHVSSPMRRAAPATWSRASSPTSCGPALGQTVVVENRAGASGAIGATAVLQFAARRSHICCRADRRDRRQPVLDEGATYEPKDLVPVALATVVPLRSRCLASAPYATMADMLKAIAASAKAILFASAGTGTPGHLAGEICRRASPGS